MEEYRRWVDNIRMDLKEIDVDVMNWMELAQDIDTCRALVKATLILFIYSCHCYYYYYYYYYY